MRISIIVEAGVEVDFSYIDQVSDVKSWPKCFPSVVRELVFLSVPKLVW